jgi:hypothetical protein
LKRWTRERKQDRKDALAYLEERLANSGWGKGLVGVRLRIFTHAATNNQLKAGARKLLDVLQKRERMEARKKAA